MVKNWTVQDPKQNQKIALNDVNLHIGKGEIVGLYGLVGSGRTEFAMSVFGQMYGKKIRGEIRKNGKEIEINSIKDAIDNGIAYIPEDRKKYGLILNNTIKDNITLANLLKISNNLVIDNNKESIVCKQEVNKLNIRASSIFQKAKHLSGGNQQKVVLSKWMFTNPQILILDEPTRGVDVGAKYEIYKIINELMKDSCALLISSELNEIFGMCDRIYVMREGEIVGEFPVEEATQEQIMKCIIENPKKVVTQ